MRTVLALDTSGPSLSVALVRGGRLVYECVQQNGRTHSESLMPQVDAALCAGGIGPGDVDVYAAVTGPGSFTGVRIGVATVKGLCQAAGKPCVAVNALRALALGAPFFPGAVCALQDARAGQVYAAAFRDGERVLADAALPLADFLARAAALGPCCFVGDGAAVNREAISRAMGEAARFAPENAMALRASAAALWALRHPEREMPWQDLLPYYLRAPQAERERAAREAREGI